MQEKKIRIEKWKWSSESETFPTVTATVSMLNLHFIPRSYRKEKGKGRANLDKSKWRETNRVCLASWVWLQSIHSRFVVGENQKKQKKNKLIK